jgi:2-polyprenyl-3-methyl-5-hydroxy-6-metoxy-1,4-benzoquinol methylase
MNEAEKSHIKLQDEIVFLNKVYSTYTVDHSLQTKVMRELTIRTFSPFLKKGRALELGCSDGYMSSMLAAHVKSLDVVDGSDLFLIKARERVERDKLKNITFYKSLFEEFEVEEKYDFIVASYILEHVLDSLDVLKMASKALNDDGLLFIVVPNANALSRQLAMHMGLYSDLKVLTENDLKHGHRRVYDRTSLNFDIERAGFITIAQGGLMLKILADFQMDRLIEDGILGQEQIDGLYKLGLEYPDLCNSLFSICKKK